MLVIGRSYWVVPIQDVDGKTEAGIKLAEEITEKSSEAGGAGVETEGQVTEEAEAESKATAETETLTAGTKLMA